MSNVNLKKLEDEKKILIITYAFKVILKYLEKKIAFVDNSILNSLGDLVLIIQQVIQLNHKHGLKIMKQTLVEIMKLDKNGELIQGINFLF